MITGIRYLNSLVRQTSFFVNNRIQQLYRFIKKTEFAESGDNLFLVSYISLQRTKMTRDYRIGEFLADCLISTVLNMKIYAYNIIVELRIFQNILITLQGEHSGITLVLLWWQDMDVIFSTVSLEGKNINLIQAL